MDRNELIVVFKSALAMAQQDGELHDQEAKVVEGLLVAAGLNIDDVGGLEGGGDADPERAVGALASVMAKRTYLLVLGAVAMADGQLDDGEADYFNQMAQRLGVGTINLKALTLEKALATAKRIIGEVPKGGGKTGPQPSDIDMM